MKLKLIDVETAILAKQVGFDIEDKDSMIKGTLQMYGTQIVPQLEIYNETKWKFYRDYTLAPEQELLAKWLRDVHNLIVYITPSWDEKDKSTIRWRNNNTKESAKIIYNSYEEAMEEGLFNALQILENKVAK